MSFLVAEVDVAMLTGGLKCLEGPAALIPKTEANEQFFTINGQGPGCGFEWNYLLLWLPSQYSRIYWTVIEGTVRKSSEYVRAMSRCSL